MAVRRLSALIAILKPEPSGVLAPNKLRPSVKTVKTSFSSSSRVQNGNIESRKVEINGAKIHFEKAGKGGHSILLLPGALGSTRTDFSPQLEKFGGDEFTVYSWDPRGYGKSRPPSRDWPLNFYQRDADDAIALIKSLGLSRVSLLGWSDGGITALIIAGRCPELCHKLVVWGCNTYVSHKDVQDTDTIRDIDKWSDRMKKPFIELYGEECFRTLWTGWVNAYHRLYHDNNGDLCKSEVEKIRCPTLIVHGQQDPLVDQEHPDYLHSRISNSRLVNWPKGKHNLHLRYPDEFNDLVRNFLLEK